MIQRYTYFSLFYMPSTVNALRNDALYIDNCQVSYVKRQNFQGRNRKSALCESNDARCNDRRTPPSVSAVSLHCVESSEIELVFAPTIAPT